MKKVFLLIVAALTLTVSAEAQQKVRQFFRVSDANFVVNNWGDDNEANDVDNSFTIASEFGAVAWDFGGPFWEPGIDLSGYDKLVIRVASCVGNNVQFRIFDFGSLNGQGGNEYVLPDDIVEMDEEVEYEIDLTEDLDYQNGTGVVDKTNIKRFTFWNYWDVNGGKSDPESEAYDPDFTDENPGAKVTVTIAAMYLERTLANGEKDYVDLLADRSKLWFSDGAYEPEDGTPYEPSSMDNTGLLHLTEFGYGGISYGEEPADWSQYRYLIVVPQTPYDEGATVTDYYLADASGNEFYSGTFRYGFYNRPRAAVLDLGNITNISLGDDETPLEAFDTAAISSLTWRKWGGTGSFEYGIAGAWLSNTMPTVSTAFGDGTDNTGDYIIENASENNVMTICLPFAAAVCGANVYTIAGIDDAQNPSELYAQPYIGVLEAGKPYILRTNSARNVTIFRAGANEVGQPEANGALVADDFTTYYVEADKNLLVLNADGDTFEAVTGRAKRINSNTAYIDCSKLSVAEEQENGLVFAVSGATAFEPSGIKMVEGKWSTMDGYIYDLSGRRVSNPSKGIYIKNGRKFIVK